MLTLEQVRAVNDGFKSGDLNAALRPLEETIDLRSNELPRLDKAAVAAFKQGLQNGDDPATWAQALLHPNISVRRFARKAFMGLGDEAAPLFDSLRQRLERYWSEEKPLAETNKPREAALRREQREMVEGALEILLRAHPEKFLAFYAEVIDATPPANNSNTQAIKEWQERNAAAWQATQKEVERLLTEEWGSEWAEPSKRWKLPSRVLREIDERARQNPEVAALWAQLGDSPYERAAVEWNPTQMMTSAFGSYLGQYKPTGPQQRVTNHLRPVVWEWAQNAFNFESSVEERVYNARRLMGSSGWWGFGNWLGTERVQTDVPALLLNAKSHLMEPLQKLVTSERGIYGEAEGEGDQIIARLWLMLVWAVANAFRRPYNVKPEEWSIAGDVEAETLRQLTTGLEPTQSSQHLFSSLQEAIKNIEETREAQNKKIEVVESSSQGAVAVVSEEQATALMALNAAKAALENSDSPLLQPYDVLSDKQIQEIYGEEGYTDKARARMNEALKKVEAEMAGVEGARQKIQLLVEPPPHPRDPKKMISRMPYWRVWSNALGENGSQKLKDVVWAEAEPKLWQRLDDKLQEYRRAETDPVEPKIEQKLTERELKEWRTQMRREARGVIASEIWDIVGLLFHVDGFDARLKAIELADRPSCRDLRDQMEINLIAELERNPGDYRAQVVTRADWENWKLGEEWEVVLRKAEAQLEKAKDGWNRANIERQLATGYYRRGYFDKFEEMATHPNVFPRSVAMAAVVLDDFEAWRVLVGSSERWGAAELTTFWNAQQEDPQRKARALEVAVCTLASTSNEETARRLLGWLDKTTPAELETYVSELENALESSLVAVKKWAMGVLGKLPHAEFDRERAAATASEALWSENGTLAKDAAKFLAVLGAQDEAVSEIAWEGLCDATALDNVGVAEAVYRALSQMKTKSKELELSEAAREKLEGLIGVNAERFAKFGKKLI